jgi:hypothetical protein
MQNTDAPDEDSYPDWEQNRILWHHNFQKYAIPSMIPPAPAEAAK